MEESSFLRELFAILISLQPSLVRCSRDSRHRMECYNVMWAATWCWRESEQLKLWRVFNFIFWLPSFDFSEINLWWVGSSKKKKTDKKRRENVHRQDDCLWNTKWLQYFMLEFLAFIHLSFFSSSHYLFGRHHHVSAVAQERMSKIPENAELVEAL